MEGDENLALCPNRGHILLRNVSEGELDSNVSVRCPSCNPHFHRASELTLEQVE